MVMVWLSEIFIFLDVWCAFFLNFVSYYRDYQFSSQMSDENSFVIPEMDPTLRRHIHECNWQVVKCLLINNCFASAGLLCSSPSTLSSSLLVHPPVLLQLCSCSFRGLLLLVRSCVQGSLRSLSSVSSVNAPHLLSSADMEEWRRYLVPIQ